MYFHYFSKCFLANIGKRPWSKMNWSKTHCNKLAALLQVRSRSPQNLEIFLSFPNFLRSQVLSRLATRETTSLQRFLY